MELKKKIGPKSFLYKKVVSQNKIISEKNLLSPIIGFDDDDDDDDYELRTISEVIGRPNFVVHALHRVTRSPISNISSNFTMHTKCLIVCYAAKYAYTLTRCSMHYIHRWYPK